MTMLKSIIRALEAPAARRMRLAQEHATRRAARQSRAAQTTRQPREYGRDEYPFHHNATY